MIWSSILENKPSSFVQCLTLGCLQHSRRLKEKSQFFLTNSVAREKVEISREQKNKGAQPLIDMKAPQIVLFCTLLLLVSASASFFFGSKKDKETNVQK
jgi:hypothetical protein